MGFFQILFLLLIVPILLAIVFPGCNYPRGASFRGFLNNYPYHVLLNEKSSLNKLLFKLFAGKSNNKRPFIYYTRIGYVILAILQIPIAIIIYYYKSNIFAQYLWVLMVICFIPALLLGIIIGILDRKNKIYKKKNGIKTESFCDILKSDRKFRALEKQWVCENLIRDAIEPYIKINNPKKRKATIVAENIEKVNAILEKDFPDAYTKTTIDEKGNKMFCVYYKGEEDKLLIKAFLKNK